MDDKDGAAALHAMPRLVLSPKSQVTRIPHAACDKGLLYIDEGWREQIRNKISAPLLCLFARICVDDERWRCVVPHGSLTWRCGETKQRCVKTMHEINDVIGRCADPLRKSLGAL
jgi:hypothetical protein